MLRFLITATILYLAAGSAAAWVFGRMDAIPALTAGAFLGIVNLLILNRATKWLTGERKIRDIMTNILLLALIGFLFVLSAYATGRAIFVLLGYSAFVLALMTYAGREAFHA